MNQLKLTPKELKEIGFKKRIIPKIEPSEDNAYGSVSRIIYEIPCINGCFYYNVNEDVYVWYHKTVIGENANHINLDITSKPELFMILSTFKVEFRTII